MSYASIIRKLPPELQPIMLELVEAVEQNMREELAVRHTDFDALRAVVQELAEAQRRTEQRVGELVEAQRRTEQRVDSLEVKVAELTEAQRRTEQHIRELVEAQRRTEQRVDRLEVKVAELIEAQRRTEEAIKNLIEVQLRFEEKLQQFQIRQDKHTGVLLEMQYRDKAHAYFGRILRKVRAVSFQEIEDDLEKLPDYERNDLLLLDLLVRGFPRSRPDVPEVWLAVEVSAVVDRNDVERAQRRAAILRRAGYVAVPAVAGEDITKGGENTARTDDVLLIQNGTLQFWDEALSKTLAV
jgi:hypothetical protein